MKITQISAWQVDLPLKEGRYNWSNGNSVSVFDSTVVEIKTDEGLYGYADAARLDRRICPLLRAVFGPVLPSWRRILLAVIPQIFSRSIR